MTSIRAAMTARAFAEFDAMVVAREAETRATMRAVGRPSGEIESYLGECHVRLAKERAAIPGNVVIELMQAGIDLEMPAYLANAAGH